MKQFEVILENNPLRRYIRELLEVRPLRAATDIGTIGHALHIACGNGSATRIILKYFSVQRLSGVDRDPQVIASARAAYARSSFDFSVQGVDQLSFPDETFDAAFDLADLHNLSDWKAGLRELRRVLKPGGLLIMEELSRESFAYAAGRLFKALTDHPYESMLTTGEFQEHVGRAGFDVMHFEDRCPLGLLKYFIMVVRKAAQP